MRWMIAVAAVSLFALPAEAGAPFRFGWTPGTVHVKSSEQYGATKLRRTYDLVLTAKDEAFVLTGSRVEVTSIEGAIGKDELDRLRRGVERTLDISSRGVAEPSSDDPEETEAVHQWNAVVGYWTGRDQSMNRPVRAKLPDGRILQLEHLGPVADPVGARHLSATVTGAPPDAVRGCTQEVIDGLPTLLKGTADTAEMVHILDTVSCEPVELIEAVVEPDTLRPHLVVLQWSTTINLPGREDVVQKSTVRRDYVWAK